MPTPGPAVTQALLVGVILALTLYDLYLIALGAYDATISRVCVRWAHDFPLLLIGVGLLIGHCFLRQPSP